jgi:hypothetical protein
LHDEIVGLKEEITKLRKEAGEARVLRAIYDAMHIGYTEASIDTSNDVSIETSC